MRASLMVTLFAGSANGVLLTQMLRAPMRAMRIATTLRGGVANMGYELEESGEFGTTEYTMKFKQAPCTPPYPTLTHPTPPYLTLHHPTPP